MARHHTRANQSVLSSRVRMYRQQQTVLYSLYLLILLFMSCIYIFSYLEDTAAAAAAAAAAVVFLLTWLLVNNPPISQHQSGSLRRKRNRKRRERKRGAGYRTQRGGKKGQENKIKKTWNREPGMRTELCIRNHSIRLHLSVELPSNNFTRHPPNARHKTQKTEQRRKDYIISQNDDIFTGLRPVKPTQF